MAGTMRSVTIIDASWHRNGVGGVGFYAVLFDDAEEGRMFAALFDEPGYCAVLNLSKLADANIRFGAPYGNSYRGDVFETALRPKLKAFWETHATNRAGPFSAPSDGRKPEPEKGTVQ